MTDNQHKYANDLIQEIKIRLSLIKKHVKKLEATEIVKLATALNSIMSITDNIEKHNINLKNKST
jgi:hypothetical protein